jgi:hypothetical protein
VKKNLSFHLMTKKFKWSLLLAAVKFPLLGVDFSRHHCLLVDPAANCLVSAASAAVAAVVSTMLPPHQPLATNTGRLTAGMSSWRKTAWFAVQTAPGHYRCMWCRPTAHGGRVAIFAASIW